MFANLGHQTVTLLSWHCDPFMSNSILNLVFWGITFNWFMLKGTHTFADQRGSGHVEAFKFLPSGPPSLP